MVRHVIGEDKPELKALLMGNEAIARGAVEGGVQVATSYPGTPVGEGCGTKTILPKGRTDTNFLIEYQLFILEKKLDFSSRLQLVE